MCPCVLTWLWSRTQILPAWALQAGWRRLHPEQGQTCAPGPGPPAYFCLRWQWGRPVWSTGKLERNQTCTYSTLQNYTLIEHGSNIQKCLTRVETQCIWTSLFNSDHSFSLTELVIEQHWLCDSFTISVLICKSFDALFGSGQVWTSWKRQLGFELKYPAT